MDGFLAIEHNVEALRRVLAALFAMAGLWGQYPFFPQTGALPQDLAQGEKSRLSPAATLPRHLYRAILRILRPAESAARRLIIALARGLLVPPSRPGGKKSPRHSARAPKTLSLSILDPLPRRRGRRRRGRFHRIWPLRMGRPPGTCRRSRDEVQDILSHANELALYALEKPDTS